MAQKETKAKKTGPICFRRITLQPGETRTVEFTLGPEQLSFLNENMERVVEPGVFEIMVGTNPVEVQMVQLEVI